MVRGQPGSTPGTAGNHAPISLDTHRPHRGAWSWCSHLLFFYLFSDSLVVVSASCRLDTPPGLPCGCLDFCLCLASSHHVASLSASGDPSSLEFHPLRAVFIFLSHTMGPPLFVLSWCSRAWCFCHLCPLTRPPLVGHLLPFGPSLVRDYPHLPRDPRGGSGLSLLLWSCRRVPRDS